MISQHDKAKRWRPRFSVRTLVVVVTLVCCYAPLWKETDSRGVSDVARRYYHNSDADDLKATLFRNWNDAYSPCPLLISNFRNPPHFVGDPKSRHYYFWFFGYVAKLPYEREIDPTPADFIRFG